MSIIIKNTHHGLVREERKPLRRRLNDESSIVKNKELVRIVEINSWKMCFIKIVNFNFVI